MDRKPEAPWWNEARAIAARQARGASDAADDLAQDLAVATLERAAPVARDGAWLERVGRNATVDRWRVERRRGELVADVPAPVAGPDPERAALARERRGVVRRALLALPRPLRRAALARFHADLPFEDVAARLGTETVTARTRVHRALARLRERLAGLRAFVPLAPGAQAAALSIALVVVATAPTSVPASLVVAAPPSARRVAVHVEALPRAPVASPIVRVAQASPRRPSAPAVAAPTPAPAVQRFSYEDDEIVDELARPEVIPVVSLPATRHLSLIELRWQLVPELLKSLEEL
jgi:RNA polymerase sigma-70 factor (ECF subfamily)